MKGTFAKKWVFDISHGKYFMIAYIFSIFITFSIDLVDILIYLKSEDQLWLSNISPPHDLILHYDI